MQANENSVLTGDQQEETTAFLLLETVERVAQNWKQILGIGILNIVTGMGCLIFPSFATQAVELFLICIVFATGLLNMLTICANSRHSYEPSYQQSPIFWVGFCQVILAILMYSSPWFTLTVLTYLIAVTFMLLGAMQIAIARRYRDRIAARALSHISGSLAVLMSIIICLSMPTARWVTIGVLLGVNLINVGTNRVVIGLYGRKLAESHDDAESWRSYLDADSIV